MPFWFSIAPLTSCTSRRDVSELVESPYRWFDVPLVSLFFHVVVLVVGDVGSNPRVAPAQLNPSDVLCPVRQRYAFSAFDPFGVPLALLPLNKFQSPE